MRASSSGLKSEAALQRLQALSATSTANRAAADTLSARLQRRANALATHAGVGLAAGRNVGPRDFVVTASGIDSTTLAARLATHADVAWAVPDRRRRATHVPNDPLFSAGPASGLGPAVGQWYLQAPDATRPSATHAQGAWDLVRGNPSVVVAVLDTGVLSAHPDLSGRVLPGYDLVSDLPTANDGNGVDADANDPGDWITSAENADRRGDFYQCGAANSSWHGTQVAGIVGASGNNGLGMAGTAFGVGILPVRVLGKCGGFDSDIIAGMRWAAGLAIDGLPTNPNPARVLNLSLGGEGSCDAAYQERDQRDHRRPLPRGDRGRRRQQHGPRRGHAGQLQRRDRRGRPAPHRQPRWAFPTWAPRSAIAAPAGNCVNVDAGQPCLYPILSGQNSGTRGALSNGWTWTDSFDISVGTSFAAPIVAGAVALMLSAAARADAGPGAPSCSARARPFPTSGSDNGPTTPRR
jgi:serine protease